MRALKPTPSQYFVSVRKLKSVSGYHNNDLLLDVIIINLNGPHLWFTGKLQTKI